jgi:hypothetical protein
MTYRVHFSGMVAFVPTKLERADGEAKKVKQMRLLLLDGRPPHKAPDGEELTPHFAFLRFRLADLASDSPRRPDLVGNNGYGVCFLNHEELDFDSGGGDDQLEATLTPLQASYGTGQAPPPPTDLTWILPLDKACGRPGKLPVDKRLLAPDYTPDYTLPPSDQAPLIARTALGSGRLYACGFRGTELAGRRLPVDCWFHPPAALDPNRPYDPPKPDVKAQYCKQPLATEVTWEPRASKRGPLEITSVRFPRPDRERGTPVPALRFRTLEEAGGTIDVDCWNATFADLLVRLQGPRDSHDWYVPTNNSSFRSFFRAVKRPNGLKLPFFEREQRVASPYLADSPCTGKNPGCPCCLLYEE